MLLLQGYPIHDLEFVMNLTEHQQADLAGNSFLGVFLCDCDMRL